MDRCDTFSSSWGAESSSLNITTGSSTIPQTTWFSYQPYLSSLRPHRCPICEGTGGMVASFYDEEAGAEKVCCKACGGRGFVWA